MDIDGTVVISGARWMKSHALYWERIGAEGDLVDIAVDPVDGTELVAKGLDNAISVVAVAPRGHLVHAPDMYMHKLAAGPKAKDAVHMDLPIDVNLRRLAKALEKDITELTVTMLDRPRHAELIRQVRATGARIKLFQAGDIAAAIAPCFEHSGVDLLIGSGGAPESYCSCRNQSLGRRFPSSLRSSYGREIKRCREMELKI